MNIAEIRNIAQLIFVFYMAFGFIILASYWIYRAVFYLFFICTTDDLKKSFPYICKGVGFVLAGCLFELVLPGSSFIFIVCAGVPLMFAFVIIIACSFMAPIALAYMLFE
jgi:hypothetical protein